MFTPTTTGNSLYCNNQELNDTKLSNILDAFLSPGIGPLILIKATNNLLTQIPSQISTKKFPNLIYIDLSFNRITTAVKSTTFSYLISSPNVYLNFNNNRIQSVAPSSLKFPAASYVEVDFSYNLIASAMTNDTFNFASASTIYLYLHKNNFTAIPSGTFNFKSAIRMYLYLPNNQLTAIASDAMSFPLVTDIILDLNQNQITSIFSNTFNFPSATWIHLYLQNNRISSLGPKAFNFKQDRLTAINVNLGNNRISAVPLDVYCFYLSRSVYLDLSDNQISANNVPPNAFNFTSSYVTIGLTSNQLTTIPSSAFRLNPLPGESSLGVNLDFRYNKIPIIPSNTFSFMSSASGVVLFLDWNGITFVSPTAFNFALVEYLTLSLVGNNLTNIPNCNAPAAAVIGFDLAANLISTIPSGVFNFLSNASKSIRLSLDENKITDLTLDSFNFYPTAQEVSISLNRNQITRVMTNSFNFLTPSASSYISISLAYNRINIIPSNTFNFHNTSRSSLELRNNQITQIQPNAILGWSILYFVCLTDRRFNERFYHFKGNHGYIGLDYNYGLSRFEEKVFKAVLKNGANPISLLQGNQLFI